MLLSMFAMFELCLNIMNIMNIMNMFAMFELCLNIMNIMNIKNLSKHSESQQTRFTSPRGQGRPLCQAPAGAGAHTPSPRGGFRPGVPPGCWRYASLK